MMDYLKALDVRFYRTLQKYQGLWFLTASLVDCSFCPDILTSWQALSIYNDDLNYPSSI